jgi:hypothetical protein
MTFTQSSTRLAALTVGAAAIVAVAFSAAVAAPALAAGICPGTTFSTNLKMGASNPSVMALQQFLNMSADTQVAATGAGSPGSETTYFGGLTKAAVNKFQLKYAAQILTPQGLSTPTGNFYAGSQAQANAVCAGSTSTGTGTGTGTTAGTATVSAAAQPANTIAPKGAARVPFTAFTVTANGSPVTINSVTVQRQGPSVDTDFAGVVLIDASTGVQVGNSRVLDANHNATIGSAITIPAGSSKTFWVAGNISTTLTNSGDIASFAVTAVNTSSTVSGSLPITGASNTINASLVIGTAQIGNSSFDPNSGSTQPIGTTGYRFSGVKVNAGSAEDVTFKSITWYQAGSASGMQNVMTVVNGTSYPTTVDATGRYYTTVFPNGIVIPKGNSVDAYVQADLGANTTASTVAEFDIYRNTDIYIVGNQYGYGITPTVSGTSGTPSVLAAHGSVFNTVATGNPFFQGSTVSVTAGTFSTIQNAVSVGAQNVATNVSNQPLGGFQTNLTGEGITVQSLKVHFNWSTAPAAGLLTSVSLVNENGATVAGPFDATNSGGTSELVTFTGSVDFPVGTHTYTLQGKIPTDAGNGATVQASTTPSTDWTNVTGDTTGNNITPSVGLFTMNTMTVKAATLTVAVASTPTSQTVVAGGSNVLFANFQLDASQSGENVRLSSLPITEVGTGQASSTLSNCQVWNGTTALNTGSRVISTSNISGAFSLSFDNALTIPKGTVVTLGLTCNISSGATGTYTFGLGTLTTGTVTGITSGTSVGAITPTGTGPTMTVQVGGAAGSLVASTDPTAPPYTVVAGGTSGIVANVIKFRASNEAVNLSKVGLVLTNGASSSVADLANVSIYTGNNIMTTAGVAIPANTLIGTANLLTSPTSTLTTIVQLPKDQDATIIVKADLADIGTNKAGNEGDLIALDYLNSEGTGVNSGVTVRGNAGVTSGVAGLRTFNSFPTLALGTAPAANPSGTNVVLKNFSVSSPTSALTGPVGLYQINIALSTSSTNVTNLQLHAFTNGYGSGVANVPGNSNGQFGGTLTPASNSPTLQFQQSTPFQVSGTVYFVLTGNVTQTGTNSNGTAFATVLGDNAYPSGIPTGNMAQAATIAGTGANQNFIWSPIATTSSITTNDWTNGFGVAGLPSTGL